MGAEKRPSRTACRVHLCLPPRHRGPAWAERKVSMTSTPDDPFHELDDPVKAKDFINSVTGGTAELAKKRVQSEIYLAYKTKATGDSLATGVKSLAETLEQAFTNHALALKNAAMASEKYASRLVWATWAL